MKVDFSLRISPLVSYHSTCVLFGWLILKECFNKHQNHLEIHVAFIFRAVQQFFYSHACYYRFFFSSLFTDKHKLVKDEKHEIEINCIKLGQPHGSVHLL